MTAQKQNQLLRKLLLALVDPTTEPTLNPRSSTAADSTAADSTAAVDGLWQLGYQHYRQRWLQVPGDHAPGRLLTPAHWQVLMTELVQTLVNQPRGIGIQNARAELLRRALLLNDDLLADITKI
ncbi:MAG: hypothetical protein R2867_16420 [Caldilineaceae bacterium]